MGCKHRRHARRPRTPRQCLFRLARKLNPEPGHAFQVRKNAALLFEAMEPLHGLKTESWCLLEAAALLHDIGTRKGMRRHHKRSRDMILARDWPGLTKDDRAMVACVARYHRRGLPQPHHRVYADLNTSQRTQVDWLAGMLRVADGLDRAHKASVRRIAATWDDQQLVLNITLRWESPEDILGALRKSDLLALVTDRVVAVQAAQEKG